MITQPTVFVLGAGVSAPFEFPTGKTLLSILSGNTGAFPTDKERAIHTSHAGLVSLMERGFGKGCMNGLIKELKSSMPPSIDTWLDYRPSHKEMGRLALAALILEHENRCLEHNFVSDNWFEWIFTRMLSNAPTLEQFLAIDITFVTFNYDRLLEWKLTKAIRGVFGEKFKNGIQAGVKALQKKVIHIHGSLSYKYEASYTIEDLFGSVSYSGVQADTGKNDSDDSLNKIIRYSADGIKIIGEKDSNDPEITRAIDAIIKATRIIFLGFSYDERNLRILGVKNWAQNKAKISYSGRAYPSLMGSAYQLRAGQQEIVKSEFCDKIELGSLDLTCVPYCNEHVVLI